MNPATAPAFYRVVVNHEGCYCIWPSHTALPSGWKPTGFSSTAEAALNQVAELWRKKTGQLGETDTGNQ